MRIDRLLILATLALGAHVGSAHAVPMPFDWTEEEAAKGWVRVVDSTWYQGGVSIEVNGFAAEPLDDDPFELRVHSDGTSVVLASLANLSQAKQLAAATTKLAKKEHYATSPLVIDTSRTGLKVVGVQWTTIDHDEDGDEVKTLFGSGYITDGTHYCWTDFHVTRPRRDEATIGLAHHIINRVTFGVMHPDPEAVKNWSPYPNRNGRKK